MPLRPAFTVLFVLLASSASLAAPPAYGEGSVIVEVRGAILTFGSSDLTAIYGPEFYESSGFNLPLGVGAGVGLGYALTPAIHIMGTLDPLMIRRRWIDWGGDGEDRWTLDGSALLAGARWFLLVSNVGNLYLGFSAGQYALSGARVDYSYATGHLDFSGSAFGGVADIGGQWMLTEHFSLMAGLGYRMARISPVRRSGTVDGETYAPGRLLNQDGSGAAIDLSGVTISAALSFSPGTPGR